MPMSPEDRAHLRYARDLLENPGLAAKLTSAVGMPFDTGNGKGKGGHQSTFSFGRGVRFTPR